MIRFDTKKDLEYYDNLHREIHKKDREIKRLKAILNELPDSLLKELDEREQNSTTILDYDGNEEIMDMADAWGGMEFFVKEFKHKVKMLIEEENK